MEKKYAEYLLQKTKEDYNLIAEDFSRTREKIWEEIKFLFDDYLIEGDRILDLGCGTGRFVELFKNRNVDYIGADISEKLIEIAKKKYLCLPKFSEGKFRQARAKFQKANALNLPFPNDYFDKVYSIAVLHHIPSEEFRLQFLKEARRVLKQEGFLILTVWKFHQRKEIFLLFKYTILKLIGKSKLDFKDIFEPWGKKTERYYHWFSKKELINLIKEAGFKIREVGIVKNKRGNRQNIYLIAGK